LSSLLKISWQGEDAPHLSVYLLGMDRFVEVVDDLVKLLPGQLGPEAVGVTLCLMVPRKPLCACLDQWLVSVKGARDTFEDIFGQTAT
jgi:hypothetical protein